MASQRKTEANRRNAQLSTGPKSPEGKAIVSRNAQKHGLASRRVVFPEENRQDFLDLLAACRSDLRPAGAFEESLVCQLVAAEWRLRRVARLETALLSGRLDNLRDYLKIDAPDPGPDGLPDHQQSTQDPRLLGRIFCRACAGGGFLNLLRYESSIRRAFYNALNRLRLHQDRRTAPPPPRKLKITEQSHRGPPPRLAVAAE